MFHPALAMLLTLALLLCPSPDRSPQSVNLGLAIESFTVSRPLVVASVSEAQTGATDLNGDGDATDAVLQVVDLARGTTRNLALASSGATTDGRWVAFAVSESAQSADLDGDGDLADAVLHVYDHASGTIRNTGLAISVVSPTVIDDGFVFFAASEAGQGTDLNGDGDALDVVLHTLDASTGATRNSGLAVAEVLGLPSLSATGGVAIVSVPEFVQGGDRNGDGDLNDVVPHLFDARDGTATNLGVAEVFTTGFIGSLAVIRASEFGEGTDLNGDGDLEDWVLHLVEAAGTSIENTGFAATTVSLSPDERFLVLTLSERMQGGLDQNGDGDADDSVPVILDRRTGLWTTLPVAALYPRFVQRPGPRLPLLMMDVLEEWQGETDLNGDGDAMDAVLHAFDLSTGAVVSSGLGTYDSFGGALGDPVDGEVLAFRVSEQLDGERDLNGDGDALDVVVHVFDAQRRRVIDTGLALFCCDANLLGAFLDVYERWVVFPVRESSQGGIDRNGDGDAVDDVLHVFDTRSRRAFDLALAVDWWEIQIDSGVYALPVREAAQGGQDLNGDGDTGDTVLHVLDLAR